VSAVVGWEITIKHAMGRLELPAPPRSWVPDKVRDGAMTPLPVELSHALAVADLPDHHRDPFDRLLIAQAHAERLTLVSADAAFDRYDVPVLW